MRTIIGLTGKAGCGKTSAALHLTRHCGFRRMRFAGPIKDMCRALGLSEAQVDGDLKEVPSELLTHKNFINLMDNLENAFGAIGADEDKPLDPVWCGRDPTFAAFGFIGVVTQAIARGEATNGATPRLLMQLVGTEWGRQQMGPDIWINAWRAQVGKTDDDALIVTDDCRFPNEVDAIRAMGGKVVDIVRPGAETTTENQHESETHQLECDFRVMNESTLDRLFDEVEDIAIQVDTTVS